MTKILIFVFSFCGYCSASQTIVPRFENLGINDGLPHSSVYSIIQDKKGFMWFGTPDGLCRYDGNHLLPFKYAVVNDHELLNNCVRGKLLEDKTGNIWYCNENGIFKWDALKEIVLRCKAFDKAEFKNSEFLSIYLDDRNCMWMINILFGIVEFNTVTNKLNYYPFPYKIDYSKILYNYTTVDDKGNIWIRIGAKNDPYMAFNMQLKSYSVHLKSNPPYAIFFGTRKQVLAYEDKLVYVDEQTKQTSIASIIINNKKKLFSCFEGIRDNYKRLWIATRNEGLLCYDENNKTFHEYHHDNSKLKSLPFNLTTCVFIDRDENLWIGTDGGGVSKVDLKQPRFNLFPLSDGDYPVINDYFTKCFYQDEKNRIWFGSQTNGLNIFDPATHQLINYHHKNGESSSLPGNIVGSIIKDKNRNMLIGSNSGISLFNVKKKTFTTIDIQGLPKLYLTNNFVNKIVQLQDGDLLAATTLGIIKISKKATGEYKGLYFNDTSLTSTTTDVAEMQNKTIYATLPGIGLYQLQPDGPGYILMQTFFNGMDLRSATKDEKAYQYLWIGSSIGLIHFNTITHAYKIWSQKDGLPNNYVYGSLQDSTGNMWISTNKGLSFFDQRKNKFQNYSFADGLQSNEFNTQAFYKSSTGVFYFGGIKGFNWFTSRQLTKQKTKPVAAIVKIEINDSSFQKDSNYVLHNSITVPYDKNNFIFHFAALDYTRPEANKFSYMLQGWDAAWVSSDNRSARYANLPPGKYILHLKIANAAGMWSDEETLKIIIGSPFWKRAWFIAIVTLLGITAIIFLTYKISQAKAKKTLRLLEKQIAVDAERYRISADMHDEIGSGITHIALLSELLQTQQKEEKELKKDINIIGTSARKLVQTMSEIIWALNPQNDSLENFLAYTREQSQQYFEPLPVQFKIDFPDSVPDIKLSNAQRRNLYLVTREALNNAMKHSGATTIELRLKITQNNYCFNVTDDGRGMNVKSVKHGSNGIRNIGKRMQDIGGTIEWIALHKGTLVEYCLPA